MPCVFINPRLRTFSFLVVLVGLLVGSNSIFLKESLFCYASLENFIAYIYRPNNIGCGFAILDFAQILEYVVLNSIKQITLLQFRPNILDISSSPNTNIILFVHLILINSMLES